MSQCDNNAFVSPPCHCTSKISDLRGRHRTFVPLAPHPSPLAVCQTHQVLAVFRRSAQRNGETVDPSQFSFSFPRTAADHELILAGDSRALDKMPKVYVVIPQTARLTHCTNFSIRTIACDADQDGGRQDDWERTPQRPTHAWSTLVRASGRLPNSGTSQRAGSDHERKL